MSHPHSLFTNLDDYAHALRGFSQPVNYDSLPTFNDFEGLKVEKKPTGDVDLNLLLDRNALQVNRKVVASEFGLDRRHRYNEEIENTNVSRLDHGILHTMESVSKLLDTRRVDSRRFHNGDISSSEQLMVNAISNVLHADLPFHDQMTCLLLIEQLTIHHGTWYSVRDFLPSVIAGDCGVDPHLHDLKLKVKDFKGASGNLEKKTTYPTVYSAFENFLLLKEQIDSIEEGLFGELEKLLNVLLKTTDYKEFIDTTLMYYGKIKPHHLDTATAEKLKSVNEDNYGRRNVVRHELAAKTLLHIYKLDCGCHTESKDWKLRILPQIVNYTFGLITK